MPHLVGRVPLRRVEGDGGLVVLVHVAAAPPVVAHVVAVPVLVRVRQVEAPSSLKAKFVNFLL